MSFEDFLQVSVGGLIALFVFYTIKTVGDFFL